jgi:hypothetical protein
MTSHYDTNIFHKKDTSNTQFATRAQSVGERNAVYNTNNNFDASLNFINKARGKVGRNLSLNGYARPPRKKGDELLTHRKTRNFFFKLSFLK